MFSLSLKNKTKLRPLIDIVCNASEFDAIPIRYKEDVTLRKLAERLPNQQKSQKWSDPHVKVDYFYYFLLFVIEYLFLTSLFELL